MIKKILFVAFVITVFATLFNGCAYFNTFYNAKQYFSQAEDEYKRRGKLNSTAATYYRKVIEKGSKVIEFYPTSKYVDDAIYLMGVSYYRLKEYNRAEKKFKELLKYFPNSPYASKAHLWLARIYMANGDFDLARNELKSIPTSDDAELIFIKSYIEEGLYNDAIKYARNFLKKYPHSTHKSEVYQYLAEAYEAIGDFRSARKYLKLYKKTGYLEDAKDKEVLYKIAELYYKDGYPDSSMNTLKKIVLETRDTLKPYVILLRGMNYEAIGDTQEAKSTYKFVLDSIRTMSKAKIEASFRLAKIYEAQDSSELAIQQYRKTTTLRGQSPYKTEADRLYHALTTVNQMMKDTAKKDTSASALLTLAETYMFDLRKPIVAESIYASLAETQAGNYIGAKALYALTYLRLNILHDTSGAASAYAKLTKWYPETVYSEEAKQIFGDILSDMADTMDVGAAPVRQPPAQVTTAEKDTTSPDTTGRGTAEVDTASFSPDTSQNRMPPILKPDTTSTMPNSATADSSQLYKPDTAQAPVPDSSRKN